MLAKRYARGTAGRVGKRCAEETRTTDLVCTLQSALWVSLCGSGIHSQKTTCRGPSMKFTHIPRRQRWKRERVDTISGRVRKSRPSSKCYLCAAACNGGCKALARSNLLSHQADLDVESRNASTPGLMDSKCQHSHWVDAGLSSRFAPDGCPSDPRAVPLRLVTMSEGLGTGRNWPQSGSLKFRRAMIVECRMIKRCKAHKGYEHHKQLLRS